MANVLMDAMAFPLTFGFADRDGTTRGERPTAQRRSPNETVVGGSGAASVMSADTTERNDGSLIVCLRQGQIMGLDDCSGVELHLQRGLLWITQTDDHRDIIVRTGERFRLDRNGLALVTATLASQLSITPVEAKQRGRLHFH